MQPTSSLLPASGLFRNGSLSPSEFFVAIDEVARRPGELGFSQCDEIREVRPMEQEPLLQRESYRTEKNTPTSLANLKAEISWLVRTEVDSRISDLRYELRSMQDEIRRMHQPLRTENPLVIAEVPRDYPSASPESRSDVARLVEMEMKSKASVFSVEITRLTSRLSKLEERIFTEALAVHARDDADGVEVQNIDEHSLIGSAYGAYNGRADIKAPETQDMESSLQDYREILQWATQEFEMTADVWGAACYVIVKDLTDIRMGDMHLQTVLQFVSIVISMITNFVLQMGFTYWIGCKVVLPNVHDVQDIYTRYHQLAYSGGKFFQEGFDSLGDDKDRLCEFAVSSNTFLMACIFLWLLRCFTELRSIYLNRRRLLHRLPTLPKGLSPDYMLRVHKEKGTLYIACLDRCTRFCIDIFVFVPRFCIAASLLFMGLVFLTASVSFSDLLFNVMALGFVFDINELIMECFTPKQLVQAINTTTVMVPPEPHLKGKEQAEAKRQVTKQVYCRSLVLWMSVSVVALCWYWLQPVLPGFERDVAGPCSPYNVQRRTILCSVFSKNCFPKGA